MVRISQLFGVFSVRALGLDADLTPSTEKDNVWLHGTDAPLSWARKALTAPFYLDLLKRVLILTMDISLNSLLSFRDLAVLGSNQSSFPILFAYHWKTDSRVALKFSPFTVDKNSIIDIYVQYEGSSVTHNVESWGGLHDLLHLFNTTVVICFAVLSVGSLLFTAPSAKRHPGRGVWVASR